MKVALLTREYPPEVYGGAGVHVEYLARELRAFEDVSVHAWGGPRDEPGVASYAAWDALTDDALRAMSIDLAMTEGAGGAELVHSHTWYANLAGHLAKLRHGIPHVVTVHSLEPLRPWKAEQLGGGYALSSWCEQTGIEGADAVIAVSEGMRRDVLACYPALDPERVRVVYNGIDADEYARDPGTEVLERLGVDAARPSVVFVGRITRQKGVPYLLDAATGLRARGAARALCGRARHAGDRRRGGARVERLRSERGNVIWVDQMLPKRDVIQLLSHATVFACPSIYEPLGIVNLEAMACEAAVVATATGGIVEVVVDGETGLLVPFEHGPARHRAARPGGVRRGDRRAREHARGRPGARGGDGPRRARARGRVVRLARDRPPDVGDLPLLDGLTVGKAADSAAFPTLTAGGGPQA